MAIDYTDATDPSIRDTYKIKSGEKMMAEDVRKALHTKEKVANKVTSLSSASTDAQYPSAKLVYDQLATKQNTLTIATSPSSGGTNPISSGGVYTTPTTIPYCAY